MSAEITSLPVELNIEDIREDALTFWNYLRVEDKPRRADAIYILGGSTLAPVYKAFALYEQGYASKIACVSIGGTFRNHEWRMSEAKKYREILLELGVNPDDILCAELTRNTLEEAEQAIPFLKRRIKGLKTVTLVSRPIHQRRAHATFKKQHPEIEYINCPADEQPYFNDLTTLGRLVKEWERLIKYAKKEDLVPQKIPSSEIEAITRVKDDLRRSG